MSLPPSQQVQVARQRPPRQADVVRHRLSNRQSPHAGRHDTQQAAHLGRSLNVGYLPNITGHQVGHVRVEEPRPAASRITAHRLRITTAKCTGHVVTLSQRAGRHLHAPVGPEDCIHEPVRCRVDLSLRQRPQLDGLRASRKRVRQTREPQKPSRTRQQEPARTRIAIYLALDGEQQSLPGRRGTAHARASAAIRSACRENRPVSPLTKASVTAARTRPVADLPAQMCAICRTAAADFPTASAISS